MALNQNKNGKWVYDRWFGRQRRVQVTLPVFIKTREEAEAYIPLIPPDRLRHVRLRPKVALKTLFDNAITYFGNEDDKSFRSDIDPFMEYCQKSEITTTDIVNLTPVIIEGYSHSRLNAVSPKTHNREIMAIVKLHTYLLDQGSCKPLNFRIENFLLALNAPQDALFSEKFFELLIEKYPSEFLGKQYKNIPTPPRLERLFPDSVLQDEQGDYFVVEIQKGMVDRNHSYKILDYRDKMESELEKAGCREKVNMMVVLIGDHCPHDREAFMQKYGIKFIKISINQVEKTILRILERPLSTDNVMMSA